MHNSKRSMDLSDTLFWHLIRNGNARALPCVHDVTFMSLLGAVLYTLTTGLHLFCH